MRKGGISAPPRNHIMSVRLAGVYEHESMLKTLQYCICFILPIPIFPFLILPSSLLFNEGLKKSV